MQVCCILESFSKHIVNVILLALNFIALPDFIYWCLGNHILEPNFKVYSQNITIIWLQEHKGKSALCHGWARCCYSVSFSRLPGWYLPLFLKFSVSLHLALLLKFSVSLYRNRCSKSFLKSTMTKCAILSMALFFFFLARSEDTVNTRDHPFPLCLTFIKGGRKRHMDESWRSTRQTLPFLNKVHHLHSVNED